MEVNKLQLFTAWYLNIEQSTQTERRIVLFFFLFRLANAILTENSLNSSFVDFFFPMKLAM